MSYEFDGKLVPLGTRVVCLYPICSYRFVPFFVLIVVLVIIPAIAFEVDSVSGSL